MIAVLFKKMDQMPKFVTFARRIFAMAGPYVRNRSKKIHFVNANFPLKPLNFQIKLKLPDEAVMEANLYDTCDEAVTEANLYDTCEKPYLSMIAIFLTYFVL